MKNFPLLPINGHNYIYNWHKSYILYLLNQTRGLYNYSYFMIPPFRQIVYENISGYEEITNLFDENGKLNYFNMPVHSFIQLKELTTPYGHDEIELPSGTWVISNARDEGDNSISHDFNYYNYSPGGYGSFYVPTDIVQSSSNTNEYTVTWTYLENAGEVFGYTPGFNPIYAANRFILQKDNIPGRLKLDQSGLRILSDQLGAYNSNFVFQKWYTLGTPMHFFFTDDENYGEEIILDETHVVNLTYGNTHSYEIFSKHKDIQLFYIDFI